MNEQIAIGSKKNHFFCLDAAWLNEVRCPGGRPSVSAKQKTCLYVLYILYRDTATVQASGKIQSINKQSPRECRKWRWFNQRKNNNLEGRWNIAKR